MTEMLMEINASVFDVSTAKKLYFPSTEISQTGYLRYRFNKVLALSKLHTFLLTLILLIFVKKLSKN
jgi:hypothetical protein